MGGSRIPFALATLPLDLGPAPTSAALSTLPLRVLIQFTSTPSVIPPPDGVFDVHRASTDTWHAVPSVAPAGPLGLHLAGWGAWNPDRVRYDPPPHSLKGAGTGFSKPFDLPLPWP